MQERLGYTDGNRAADSLRGTSAMSKPSGELEVVVKSDCSHTLHDVAPDSPLFSDLPHPHQHFIHRANWLRAAVLGANDGLVSVASLTLGVGGALPDRQALLVSAVAGLVSGALSMAAGEYVSVSSQRDIEKADVEKERLEQLKGPEAQARELAELTEIYIDRGLKKDLAREVAVQLSAHDVIRAHARDELGIDISHYTNPWTAAFASMASFAVGAFVPIVPLLIPGMAIAARMAVIVVAVTLALAFTGSWGAWVGGASVPRGALRVTFGGWLAMGVTFAVGKLFNVEIEA